MEHDSIKLMSNDIDLEDGEISDSDGSYTPLQRPDTAKSDFVNVQTTKMDQDQDGSDLNYKSSNSDSSDSDGFDKIMKRKIDSPFKLRPLDAVSKPRPPTNPKANKYNIWTASLQEDSLMENMRGCDVTKNEMRNRDVESYDYSIKYRLNGESSVNPLKRRQSNSDDSDTFNRFDNKKKFRGASNKKFNNRCPNTARKSVKLRLGSRSDDSNSNDSSHNAARYILDLNINEESENEHIAREIATKLCEEKDDLLKRVVNVLGKDIAIKLFKETQKIESAGGMLIMNGIRRRTPGGVFLFLLKHNEQVTSQNKKLIFIDEHKKAIKNRKHSQALNREKKVEELKKTLNEQAFDNELPTIPLRKESLIAHLKPETHSTLSNPPPSPVTDVNRESSPDYETQSIVHVNVTSPEKVTYKDNNVLNTYDDDILDMNCDDMDLF